MRLRRLLRAYHRDVGYFVSALTLSYCVSGVAVNHMADWNPNYAISREQVQLKPLSGDLSAMEAAVVSQLGIEAASVRGRLREGPDQLKIFLPEGGEVAVRISTGAAKVKRVEPRAGLYQVNALHLNRLKGGWTYVADAFALLLGSWRSRACLCWVALHGAAANGSSAPAWWSRVGAVAGQRYLKAASKKFQTILVTPPA